MRYEAYRALPPRRRAFIAINLLRWLGHDVAAMTPRDLTPEEGERLTWDDFMPGSNFGW
jgi:hypothetical protein